MDPGLRQVLETLEFSEEKNVDIGGDVVWVNDLIKGGTEPEDCRRL